MRFYRERRALLEAAQRMFAEGLTRGTSGNVSVRVENGFLVTPTGLPWPSLRTEDLVEVDDRGTPARAQRTPSSEWRLHRDLYAGRRDVHAVVHAHPMFSTTLSCLRQPIPAVHYMIAATGREVRCAPYATFGTEELSRATVATLGSERAVLMANHGLLTVGPDLETAMKVALQIEELAEIYWRARQVGTPHVLDDAEMGRVIERFKTYGQQGKPPRD